MDPVKAENKFFLPSLYWITVIFAGILRLNRTFENEKEDNAWKLLIILPLDKSAIYLGKLFGNLFIFVLLEIILLPLFIVFFDVSLNFSLAQFALISFLGMLGFSALGTIISAVSMNLKMKEIMLPVLLIPLLIPVLIGSVEGTIACFSNLDEVWKWVRLVAAFDVIYVSISILLFDFITS
jgi:heme exporter protein B